MVKTLCPKCKRLTRTPFRTCFTQCERCNTRFFFIPTKILFNVGFLIFLVMPFVPLVATISMGLPDAESFLTLIAFSLVALCLPLLIYGLAIVFGSTRLPTAEEVKRYEHIETLSVDLNAPASRTSSHERPSANGFLLLIFFIGFLVWCYVYLALLRPMLNEWLFQYINSYPALLHIVPLLGGPILVAFVVFLMSRLLTGPRQKSR